ncbi:MAG: cupredoxin domain-containing protein [Candidatus Gottesmanbacteria bacterium]
MNTKVIIGIFAIIIVGLAMWYILGKQSGYIQANNQRINPFGSSLTSNNASQVIVKATADGFSPGTVNIKSGSKVTWSNTSGQAISINSNNHPTHLLYPPLNLGIVEDGNSVTLIFDKPGTYGYHNHLQPSQTGEIIVK